MIKKRAARFVGMVCGALVATAAGAETWRCKMRHVDVNGWVSHKLEVQVGRDGAARVLDSAVAEMLGRPIEAELKENKGVRLKVKWVTRNLSTRSGVVISRSQYSAFINRQTGRVSVSVILPLGDAIPTGSGQCKRYAGTGGFAPTSAPRHRYIVEIPEW